MLIKGYMEIMLTVFIIEQVVDLKKWKKKNRATDMFWHVT